MPWQERGLADRHALDLLEAFRRDVTKRRYADWDELMDYCRYSAAPVGRFVLDLHGESPTLWPAQRRAVRGAAGHQPSPGLRQGLPRARPRLRAARCARRPGPGCAGTRRATGLAAAARRDRRPGRSAPAPCSINRDRSPIASPIGGWRWKSAVIQALAESLVHRLERRDPLSERVHHRPAEAAAVALRGALGVSLRRLGRMFGFRQPGLHGSQG